MLAILLLLSALVAQVVGHGRVTSPKARSVRILHTRAIQKYYIMEC